MATPPLIESGDVTYSNNEDTSTNLAVSYPNASSGDLLIFTVGWPYGSLSDVTAPAGENSETLTVINGQVTNDPDVKAWYCVATDSWTASTLTFTTPTAQKFAAYCIRVPAGEFDADTPIGEDATVTGGSDAEVDSPAFQAGATDGDGTLLWNAQVDKDVLGTVPTGWTELHSNDPGTAVSGLAVRDAAVTNSENISSVIWPIAADTWASSAFIVRAPAAAGGLSIPRPLSRPFSGCLGGL